MARQPSAILTPAQQKAVETLTTLKAELKIANTAFKELNKTATAATKVAAKQAAVAEKLQAKIDKLTPAKPVVQSVMLPEQIAKAA